MNTGIAKRKLSAWNAAAAAGRVKKLGLDMRKSWLSYLFIAPFCITFIVYIMIPTVAAIVLSFTRFNSVEPPEFVGLLNYKVLLTQDLIFWKYAIPNTFLFAVVVGPVAYVLSFGLAWLISQLPSKIRLWYTLAMYTPSLTAGIAMGVIWLVLFSGDRLGYLNSFLLQLGIIDTQQLWTTDPKFLMKIMIIVTLWSSMGVGFLALLAGIQNVDPTLYEAGRIDGIKSRLQEIWYITIPAMKPQMLFGAVMATVGTFKAGAISTELSGSNPSPQYAGHLLINHIDDYGFIRYELGYASTISVVLLLVIYFTSKLCWRLFGSKEDE
ncbi:carbohydrate ABC transporter permease [Paenibacillus contaminans]|uniref:Sugar ABC transporter permease n=1 Tax=Paenibacillus contaminans TaxID=450362 RepID=A0A329MIJ8_9BACL|nr:sugar ABC transporter permease [Paenibacillus contaminans]